MAGIMQRCFLGLFYNFDHLREPFLYCLEQKKKTPTELVSVFVLLHCQNSSAVCAEARYEGFEHTHTYAHTHARTHTCAHTLMHT